MLLCPLVLFKFSSQMDLIVCFMFLAPKYLPLPFITLQNCSFDYTSFINSVSPPRHPLRIILHISQQTKSSNTYMLTNNNLTTIIKSAAPSNISRTTISTTATTIAATTTDAASSLSSLSSSTFKPGRTFCRRCCRDIAVFRRCVSTGQMHTEQTQQAITGDRMVRPIQKVERTPPPTPRAPERELTRSDIEINRVLFDEFTRREAHQNTESYQREKLQYQMLVEDNEIENRFLPPSQIVDNDTNSNKNTSGMLFRASTGNMMEYNDDDEQLCLPGQVMDSVADTDYRSRSASRIPNPFENSAATVNNHSFSTHHNNSITSPLIAPHNNHHQKNNSQKVTSPFSSERGFSPPSAAHHHKNNNEFRQSSNNNNNHLINSSKRNSASQSRKDEALFSNRSFATNHHTQESFTALQKKLKYLEDRNQELEKVVALQTEVSTNNEKMRTTLETTALRSTMLEAELRQYRQLQDQLDAQKKVEEERMKNSERSYKEKIEEMEKKLALSNSKMMHHGRTSSGGSRSVVADDGQEEASSSFLQKQLVNSRLEVADHRAKLVVLKKQLFDLKQAKRRSRETSSTSSNDSDYDDDENKNTPAAEFYEAKIAKLLEQLELEKIASARAANILASSSSHNNNNTKQQRSGQQKSNLMMTRDDTSQTETKFILKSMMRKQQQEGVSETNNTNNNNIVQFVELKSAECSAIGFESSESSIRTTESEKERRREETEQLRRHLEEAEENAKGLALKLRTATQQKEDMEESHRKLVEESQKQKQDLAKQKKEREDLLLIIEDVEDDEEGDNTTASGTNQKSKDDTGGADDEDSEKKALMLKLKVARLQLRNLQQDHNDLFDKNLDLVDELHNAHANENTMSNNNDDQEPPRGENKALPSNAELEAMKIQLREREEKIRENAEAARQNEDNLKQKASVTVQQISIQLEEAETEIIRQNMAVKKLEEQNEELRCQIDDLNEQHDETFHKNLELIDEVVELRQQQQQEIGEHQKSQQQQHYVTTAEHQTPSTSHENTTPSVSVSSTSKTNKKEFVPSGPSTGESINTHYCKTRGCLLHPVKIFTPRHADE